LFAETNEWSEENFSMGISKEIYFSIFFNKFDNIPYDRDLLFRLEKC